MQRELLFSVLVFILSITGAFFSYYAVIKEIHYDNTIISEIAPGIFDYSILENDKCIGTASYELSVENNISEIKSRGGFNIQYLSQKFSIDFLFESSFNSIGQMGGTVLKINLLDKYVVFGTVNIDPIKITIKSNLLENDREFSWSVAGPVEIRKANNEKYYVTGLAFGKIKKEKIKLFDKNVLGSLPLQFMQSDLKSCKESEKAYFDITPYVDSVKKLYSGYINL